MQTHVLRSLVAVLLALLVWLAWRENHKPDRPHRAEAALIEDQPERDAKVEAAGGYRNPAVFFTYIIFIAVAGGVMLLKWVIPAIGDRFAESMFSSTEKVEQTETQKAMSLVAQGEFHKALEAFRKIIAHSPQDRMAVTEMARLHMDRMGNLDAGILVLEEALKREWPQEDHCFLLLRLADIRASRQQDYEAARRLLTELQSRYPNSHHAANAHHKLHEIDEAEYMARRQQS